MDSNPIRPQHYKTASEVGRPFLLALHPFGDNSFEVECYIVLEALGWHHDAYLFQAAAYLWRLGEKDPIAQDLKKALWFLKRHECAFGIDRTRAQSKAAIAAIEKYLAEVEIND